MLGRCQFFLKKFLTSSKKGAIILKVRRKTTTLGGNLSVYDTLKQLNLPEDTMAVLTCSEGTDVFIHNETEVETALAETDVVYYLSELLATPGLDVRDCWSGSSILNTLREDGYLEDYRRDNTFAEYLVETINENFYDTEIVESSTEKYDHKRGFTTLTAVVQVPVANLIHNTPLLGGWDVSVKTPHGTLNLEQ